MGCSPKVLRRRRLADLGLELAMVTRRCGWGRGGARWGGVLIGRGTVQPDKGERGCALSEARWRREARW
ncbi:hypothetical protein E2562_010534 [Oryza meyeriana var. granulata]|uniref:Uncharacterized protein n=1 Tax=Oryza meyeriana var. granulata TaxID=110450 RepID=A0A6G1DW24_9ORYZ|nr:hypothetical protein E2562_010534 [Oryza meyeriana var. granulata]